MTDSNYEMRTVCTLLHSPKAINNRHPSSGINFHILLTRDLSIDKYLCNSVQIFFSFHCPSSNLFGALFCVLYHLSSEPIYVDEAERLLCVYPNSSFSPERSGKLISQPPKQWEPFFEPWPRECGRGDDVTSSVIARSSAPSPPYNHYLIVTQAGSKLFLCYSSEI